MSSRSSFRTAATLSALALSVASCGGSISPSERSVLAGRSFVAVSAEGLELPAGSALRLTFDGLRLQMSGGCNTGSADYDLVDGILVMEGMSLTEMACEQPLMDLDAAVAGMLAGGPTVQLEGDNLTLLAGERTVSLVDRRLQPADRELEGTLWVVHTAITGDTTVGGFEGAVATVQINGGSAAVNGGCNTGSASATVGDTSIEFGPILLTKMACAQPTMELEFMVAVVLQGTVSFRIQGDEMTVLNGDNGLVLSAAAEA